MNDDSILILFGGTSDERRVSVASGQNVAHALPGARLWFMSPDGAIHEVRRETLLAHERPFEIDFAPGSPVLHADVLRALDDASIRDSVFFLGLHGGEGENGTLQAQMEKRKLAFTGSGSRASAKAFDKVVAKEIAIGEGIRVAKGVTLRADRESENREVLRELFAETGPLILKPVANGSSIGLHTVRSASDIATVTAKLAALGDTAYLAETFIRGRELTIGVMQDENGCRALPPSEARTAVGRDFDYDGKYLGRGVQEITPAEISPDATRTSQKLSLTMHQALGCEGYTRTDAILTETGLVYLETNTLPGLTRASFIPQQLAAAGITFADFLSTQISVARRRNRRDG